MTLYKTTNFSYLPSSYSLISVVVRVLSGLRKSKYVVWKCFWRSEKSYPTETVPNIHIMYCKFILYFCRLLDKVEYIFFKFLRCFVLFNFTIHYSFPNIPLQSWIIPKLIIIIVKKCVPQSQVYSTSCFTF